MDFEIIDGVLKKYTGPGGDVVIPEGVTAIDHSAFKMCASRITSISIPGSVQKIEGRTFANLVDLTSVILHEGVTEICEKGCDYNSGAFHNCPSLTTVTLPDSLRSVSKNAFRKCDSLKEAIITSAFARDSKKLMMLPAKLKFRVGANDQKPKTRRTLLDGIEKTPIPENIEAAPVAKTAEEKPLSDEERIRQAKAQQEECALHKSLFDTISEAIDLRDLYLWDRRRKTRPESDAVIRFKDSEVIAPANAITFLFYCCRPKKDLVTQFDAVLNMLNREDLMKAAPVWSAVRVDWEYSDARPNVSMVYSIETGSYEWSTAGRDADPPVEICPDRDDISPVNFEISPYLPVILRSIDELTVSRIIKLIRFIESKKTACIQKYAPRKAPKNKTLKFDAVINELIYILSRSNSLLARAFASEHPLDK